MRFCYKQIVEEEFEELSALTRVSATFKCKLEQGEEHERRHDLVEELARGVHHVALLGDASEQIEQLLCHEV